MVYALKLSHHLQEHQALFLVFMSDWFVINQAAIILAAMVSGKNIWRLKFWQLATNRLKDKLTWKIINGRSNLIKSTSGGITCLSL